jgi:hypothetical protein
MINMIEKIKKIIPITKIKVQTKVKITQFSTGKSYIKVGGGFNLKTTIWNTPLPYPANQF